MVSYFIESHRVHLFATENLEKPRELSKQSLNRRWPTISQSAVALLLELYLFLIANLIATFIGWPLMSICHNHDIPSCTPYNVLSTLLTYFAHLLCSYTLIVSVLPHSTDIVCIRLLTHSLTTFTCCTY